MENNLMSDQERIHAKGFSFGRDTNFRIDAPNEYKTLKVGVKTLDDAVLSLGSLKKITSKNGKGYGNKAFILQALANRDMEDIRAISNFFYDINGLYKRACKYAAYLYRYDWYVVPEIYDDSMKEDKLLKDFAKTLNYLDNTYIKKMCGDIALDVIKNGAYYGYKTDAGSSIVIQQLPIKYCRSRYFSGQTPAVEFNMNFFDEQFRDINYRMRVLKMFPDEFIKGYALAKAHKLKNDNENIDGSNSGNWYLLDPKKTVKFSFNDADMPLFIDAIPTLLDLDAAQDLDRRKQMQKLLKIIVQKLPMDKNGELIFDVEEARDIHNNAVEMLKRAIGVDVLTTFTDVDSIDMSDKNTTTSMDDLAKVERSVFNSMGISQNLFNTSGNLSLEKSILNDESSMRGLLFQFSMFFDKILQQRNTNAKKYKFKFYMLETTQYNYKELSKMYKEQTQIGYSKMLPQIALGHSQSFILNTVMFENDILHLSEIMIPPLMSSTMNGQDLGNLGNRNKDKTPNKAEGKNPIPANKKLKESAEMGRPEKPDDEKSEKTIQNKESMS